MKKECVVLYVEGETDEEFYNKIKENIKDKIPSKKFSVDVLKVVCIKGIGNISFKLLNKFKNEIVKIYPDYNITVFLCYDNDVFEYGLHPPVDRDKLKSDLIMAGAKEVNNLIAYRSIEDYLLIDTKGILKFLRLNQKTKINGKTGLDKIKYIFKKANKTYIKGTKVAGLVDALDLNLICKEICPQLSALCIKIGLNCPYQQKKIP